MMGVRVELFGLARHLTGARDVTVAVPPGARLRDVARALAAGYPALVGPVLAPDGEGLVEPHVFNVDGLTADLDATVGEGGSVCLMFVVQGG